MSLVYIEKVPSSLRIAFENTVRAICDDLGIANPDWLMIVMWAESKLNPQAKNPSSTATGLIQFLEATARSLGTTTAALSKMNHVQQLPYVKAYLQQAIKSRGVPKDAYQLYFLVHFPSAFGKSDTTVLYRAGSSAYSSNPLDYNKDSVVTVAEVKIFLQKACPVGYDINNLEKKGSLSSQTGKLLLWVLGITFFALTGYFMYKPDSWESFKEWIKDFIKHSIRGVKHEFS